MNIKEFYKEQKKHEEETFSQRTGLKIRHAFQKYNDGSDCDEVFSLQSSSHKECIGIDFSGCVFYLLPKSHEDTVILIFDDSFMPLLNAMSNWSEARLNIYGRHVPSFMKAVKNVSQGKFSDIATFMEDEMLCFARQIKYPLIDKIEEGYIMEAELIQEITSLIQFRNKCETEFVSFDGFTPREEKEIALKEGLSFLKRGFKIMSFTDWNTTND